MDSAVSPDLPTPLLEQMALTDAGEDMDMDVDVEEARRGTGEASAAARRAHNRWWDKFFGGREQRSRGSLASDDMDASDDDSHDRSSTDDGHDVLRGPKPVSRARRVACCVMPWTLLSLLVTYLGAFMLVVPRAGQAIIDEATLNVVRMHMQSPTPTTIVFNATVELHDVGLYSSKMLTSDVEIYHDGFLLAAMTMPELDISGGEVLKFNMETTMLIKNVSAFTRATAKILQGTGGVWYIKGRPEVQVDLVGLTRSFHVDMYKELLIPPTLLEDVVGYDTEVVPGGDTAVSFNISSRTSYFSSSILEMYHLGLFVFDLEVVVDKDGRLVEDPFAPPTEGHRNVTVGQVFMDDFDLRQGINDLAVGGRVVKSVSASGFDNSAVLGQFVSNFMDGADQWAMLRGPVASASPFLDGVVAQRFTFKGLAGKPPVLASYISKRTTAGFSVKLPSGKRVHYRGTEVLARNPLHASVAQENIVTEVLLEEPLGYNLTSQLLGDWHCPPSRDLVELYSAPGMYQGDPARPPVVHMRPGEDVSFFLPGRPRAGQIKQKPCTLLGAPVAGDYDCCMVSVQTAAACRARQHGRRSFNVETRSSFDLVQGKFRLPVQSLQKGVPTVFDDALVDGFLLDAELKCADISFLP